MNIAQQLINGLVLASGYACVAIGWTVLLGAARLVNFAHGQLYMLGAFVAWAAMDKVGCPTGRRSRWPSPGCSAPQCSGSWTG